LRSVSGGTQFFMDKRGKKKKRREIEWGNLNSPLGKSMIFKNINCKVWHIQPLECDI